MKAALLLSMIWAAMILFAAGENAAWLKEWLTIRRICSWCNCHLGGNPFIRRKSKNVSHGICKRCLREQIRSIPK